MNNELRNEILDVATSIPDVYETSPHQLVKQLLYIKNELYRIAVKLSEVGDE